MVTRKTPLYLTLLLIIGFASCKKSAVKPDIGKALVLSSLEQQKVVADNAFTLKLFRDLDSANATSGSNLFISPLSVSFALGMTANGATGQTLAAMKKSLNFGGLTQDQVNGYYNNLVTNLPQLDPNTTLNIANSIWYRKDFSVLPAFLQTNTTSFKAKVQGLDFNDPSSVGTINNWVSSQTAGKISSIINNISGNDVMFLINAIYFKSSWAEKFDPAQTKPKSFYLAGNTQVQAPFMTGNINYNYTHDETATVFELPYSNSRYSMVIVLPLNSGSVHSLIAGLDSTRWQKWMSTLSTIKAPIYLPKFKYSFSTSMNEPLTRLGMGVAFSDAADFSLISSAGHLQITAVNHKAVIETDENGSTAAAATSVTIRTTAIAQPPVVTIDHPFMFAIREKSSGLILFTGVVNNPLAP